MLAEDLKKQIRTIDLAVSAGNKRQSPRTGFVHLFPNEESTDTIPIYENFCYALALFRQKTAGSVTEGKELVAKLLAFQAPDGNFPIYLHDFPRCHDFQMLLKVAPILIYLLRLFPTVLGDLKAKIEEALARALAKAPEKPFWENRYRACKGLSLLPVDTSEFSSSDWTDWLITAQLAGQTHFEIPYDEEIQLLRGNSEVQEKGEPRPSPIEWLLADGHFTPRLLRDHPHQLLCAPLFPISYTLSVQPESSFRHYWSGSVLHSLVGKGLVFDLQEGVEQGRHDLFEAALFCNISPETALFVNDRKATTFQFGDTVAIETPQQKMALRFELTSGSGDFCGHIFRSNRPTQICKGYEAYDWQVGIRTLRRSPTAQIKIHFTQSPA
jgi:hypothetical protein